MSFCKAFFGEAQPFLALVAIFNVLFICILTRGLKDGNE